MAYTLERVIKEFREICASQDIPVNVPITLNGRLTRTLGRVISLRHCGIVMSTKVEFSKQFLETSTDESIRSVIEHEACHYMVTWETEENHGHDEVFKAMCARIGCTNDKTSTKVERTVAESQVYKYFITCPKCGIIGKYSRACKAVKNVGEYWCNKCGKDSVGTLSVVQNWQKIKSKVCNIDYRFFQGSR